MKFTNFTGFLSDEAPGFENLHLIKRFRCFGIFPARDGRTPVTERIEAYCRFWLSLEAQIICDERQVLENSGRARY